MVAYFRAQHELPSLSYCWYCRNRTKPRSVGKVSHTCEVDVILQIWVTDNGVATILLFLLDNFSAGSSQVGQDKIRPFHNICTNSHLSQTIWYFIFCRWIVTVFMDIQHIVHWIFLGKEKKIKIQNSLINFDYLINLGDWGIIWDGQNGGFVKVKLSNNQNI